MDTLIIALAAYVALALLTGMRPGLLERRAQLYTQNEQAWGILFWPLTWVYMLFPGFGALVIVKTRALGRWIYRKWDAWQDLHSLNRVYRPSPRATTSPTAPGPTPSSLPAPFTSTAAAATPSPRPTGSVWPPYVSDPSSPWEQVARQLAGAEPAKAATGIVEVPIVCPLCRTQVADLRVRWNIDVLLRNGGSSLQVAFDETPRTPHLCPVIRTGLRAHLNGH